jgi:hypothetical protein
MLAHQPVFRNFLKAIVLIQRDFGLSLSRIDVSHCCYLSHARQRGNMAITASPASPGEACEWMWPGQNVPNAWPSPSDLP